MKTTTIITGVVGALGVASTTLNDDGTVNREKRNGCLATGVASTATTIAGAMLNEHGVHEIYEKYSQAYVQSMSDEELEKAITELGLLDSEQETTVTKTFVK